MAYIKKIHHRKTNDLDDAVLCEKSRVWHALFVDHLPRFTTLNPMFTMSFANNWLTKTEDFELFPSDHTKLAEVEEATALIADRTKAFLVQLTSVEYYAGMAFPGNYRIMEEFGFGRLRTLLARANGRWVVAAFVTRNIMIDYEPQLLAANMPAILPLDFNEALSALGDADVEQEYRERLRLRATTLRIANFNELFDIHRQVKKAANIIFRNEPKVKQQFY
ncbi:MAG: hypothetical protein V4615_11725 [Bacteroidota bacterium]